MDKVANLFLTIHIFYIIKNPATFLFAGFCSRFDEITSLLVAQFQLNTPVFHPVFFGFAII